MIVAVDLSAEPPALTVRECGDRRRVVVEVNGGLCRASLDTVLSARGAGCAPGHHAELAVTWLDAHVAGTAPPGRPGPWWPSGLVDETGRWVMAAIHWCDDDVDAANTPLAPNAAARQ